MFKNIFALFFVFAFSVLADNYLFTCGTYYTQCSNGARSTYQLTGPYNQHSKSVTYTLTIYSKDLCTEGTEIFKAVYVAPVTNCHNATTAYYPTVNCTVTDGWSYKATMLDNSKINNIITCDKTWKNGESVDVYNNDYACKYESYSDINTYLINKVNSAKENSIFLFEHYTSAIYFGFKYAGNKVYLVDDYGCDGYVRPITINGSNAGWIVAVVIVVVVACIVFWYFKRQKKIAQDDNFTLMEEKATHF